MAVKSNFGGWHLCVESTVAGQVELWMLTSECVASTDAGEVELWRLTSVCVVDKLVI